MNLLDEINDEELNSLDCSNLDTQRAYWSKAMLNVNRENLEALLSNIDFDLSLVEFGPLNESRGIINKIFLLKTLNKRTGTNGKDLILKLNNPEPKWLGFKTDEAALINYLRENTNVPVPSILSYSSSADNKSSPLKCSFILMERVEGVTLRDLMPSKASEIPQTIIDQLCNIGKSLKQQIKPLVSSEVKIGAIDANLNLIPIYPLKRVANSYLDHWNMSITYAISEMRKLRKYRPLADRLEQKRDKLMEIVHNHNDQLSKLNGSELGLVHGDLNPTNIIIDPVTLRIECLLDWEWAYWGFDAVEGLYESWFDDDDLEQRTELNKRFAEQFKLNHSDWWLKYQAAATTVSVYADGANNNSNNTTNSVEQTKISCLRQYLNHVYYLAFFVYNYYILEFEQQQQQQRQQHFDVVDGVCRLQLRKWLNDFANLLDRKIDCFDEHLNRLKHIY